MAITEVTGFLKYKDADGNITLLRPFATVEGMDSIVSSLSETVRFTEQTLTDEQKNQVKANLGLTDTSSPDGMPPITEEDEGKLLIVQNGQWVKIPSSRFATNKISITSFTVSPSTAELGSSVNSVVLNWGTNKTVVSQTLNGEELISTERTKRIDFEPENELTSSTNWALKVIDEEGGTASRSVTLSFLNGVYYGVSAIPETIDRDFILSLSDPVLRSSHLPKFTVTAAADQYIWYVQPKQFGERKFSVGGFEGGFSLVEDSFEFTNGQGYTNPNGYHIYRSDNIVPGETEVVIS